MSEKELIIKIQKVANGYIINSYEGWDDELDSKNEKTSVTHKRRDVDEIVADLVNRWDG